MARHVIYVPGIGDHRTYGQNFAIQLWRLFGLKPHYLALGWSNPETFELKLSRLLALVDKLNKNGDSVSLVGISAGASAVLNAYAQNHSIAKVICIVGKIQRPELIKPHTFQQNPDFEDSMNRVQGSLRKLREEGLIKNILSIHSLRDQVVAVEDTKIDGAIEKTTIGWSHTSGIFFGVIFGSYSISKFIRSGGKHLNK